MPHWHTAVSKDKEVCLVDGTERQRPVRCAACRGASCSTSFWEELPNRKLIFLIEDVCSAPAETGIRADSRLASLLMDFYLYRTVVYNWRKIHRHVPLLRCGGSFLVLCKTRKRAESLHVDLKKLLSKSGMPMDESQGTLISRLAAGEKVSWLGYEISRQDSAWVVDAADSK